MSRDAYPIGQYSARIPEWSPDITQQPQTVVRHKDFHFLSQAVTTNQEPTSNLDVWKLGFNWVPQIKQPIGAVVEYQKLILYKKVNDDKNCFSEQDVPPLSSQWQPQALEKPILNFGDLELKDYQKKPLNVLLQGQRGLLIAHGVGSGKTLTGTALAVNLLHLGQVNNVQILVPVKLAEQWKNNIRRFVPAKQMQNIQVSTQEQMLQILAQRNGLAGGSDDPLDTGLSGGLTFVDDESIQDDRELVERSKTDLSEEYRNSVNLLNCLREAEPEEEFIQGGQTCSTRKQSVVIFDEAHEFCNFKTQIQALVRRIADQSAQVVCMTATPIVNSPQDASIHFCLFTKQYPAFKQVFKSATKEFEWSSPGYLPLDENTFFQTYMTNESGDETLDPLSIPHYMAKVANYVSTYNVQQKEQPGYPERRDVDLSLTTVYMSDAQYNIQKDIKGVKATELGKSNAFLTGTRMASNSVADRIVGDSFVTEPKIARVVQVIQQSLESTGDQRLPVIVYSEFKDRGTKRVRLLLKQLYESTGRNFDRVLYLDGSTPEKEVSRIQDRLQDPKSQDVFIISSAGSVGIDTKGVRQMHILEPPWNQTSLDQTIGRAIRNQSHKDLDPEFRNVQVFQWILKLTPEQQALDFAVKSVDEYVQNEIVKTKHDINRQFLDLMVCNSIESLISNDRSNCETSVISLQDYLLTNFVRISPRCRLLQTQQPLRYFVNPRWWDVEPSNNFFKRLDDSKLAQDSNWKPHYQQQWIVRVESVVNKMSAQDNLIQRELTETKTVPDFMPVQPKRNLVQTIAQTAATIATNAATAVAKTIANVVTVGQAVQDPIIDLTEEPYFEKQVGLKCLRHALNMAVGYEQFIIQRRGPIEFGDEINLQALCEETNRQQALRIDPKKQPAFFMQCKCENYDRMMVSQALAQSRREYAEFDLQDPEKRPQIVNDLRRRLPEYERKQYSIIFFDNVRRHYQALRYFNNVWWSLDSLNEGPEEVNYLDFMNSQLSNLGVLGVYIIQGEIEENLWAQEVAARIATYLRTIEEGARLEAARAARAAAEAAAQTVNTVVAAVVAPVQTVTAVVAPVQTVTAVAAPVTQTMTAVAAPVTQTVTAVIAPVTQTVATTVGPTMNKPRVLDVDPRDRLGATIAATLQRYGPPRTDPELERALEQRRKELDERRKQQVQFEKDILLAENPEEIARVQEARKRAEDERYREAREREREQQQREQRIFGFGRRDEGVATRVPLATQPVAPPVIATPALDFLRKSLGI